MQVSQKFWIKRELLLLFEFNVAVIKWGHTDWSESYDHQTDVRITKEWLNFHLPSASDNVVPYLLIYIGIRRFISWVL